MCVFVRGFACGIMCFHALASQELYADGPLRGKAEKVFEAKKKEWLCSQQLDSAQKNTMEYFGNVEFEAEDEDKERDRMCDTKDDIFISACDGEEGEDIPVEVVPPEYLEVKGTI